MKRFATALLMVFLVASLAGAGERKPVKPSKKDKCAVCGMFVSGYPDFAAQILFKDGSSAFFDGTKDMFKYYLNMKRYNPAKKEADIDSVYVMDYYGLAPIDGQTAFYVVGSDVLGPMGKELIAFRKEADAKAFKKDHKGKKIVSFKEVNNLLMGELD
ncbi:MAG: nitrous oxide reductase accessory protein NosL [Geobacter sp.]|nr:MAG: nitrous oxide reductase accessory protein NosL [Geobacter sp.]